MSMRAALPFLLALALGVAAAGLVACGSSGSSRRQLIPVSSADRMKNALDDARKAVDGGNCTTAQRALARARGVLVNLPSSVNAELVARLRQGLDNLQQIAPQECQKQQTQTQAPTTTQTAPPATTTETTPSTTTETTPTTTTTTPTTTTPTSTAPPATTTTAPANPSGGATTP